MSFSKQLMINTNKGASHLGWMQKGKEISIMGGVNKRTEIHFMKFEFKALLHHEHVRLEDCGKMQAIIVIASDGKGNPSKVSLYT